VTTQGLAVVPPLQFTDGVILLFRLTQQAPGKFTVAAGDRRAGALQQLVITEALLLGRLTGTGLRKNTTGEQREEKDERSLFFHGLFHG